ncbi:ribose-phosphate pyrophosphokinase [Acrasis kona]|uniref:Ribose-phosphate pyrophosphokinase 2 n=1 Tax=Acrasis kona TaxID=1008807 RepID=A0AAW2YLG1_9EUKA
MSYTLKLFSGTANPDLSEQVSKQLGISVSTMGITRFVDGEVGVQILENVRGCDIFIVQSTCTPVNDNLMELALITDAMRRASAKRITAVIPYYGYARQDRKTKPRVPISAALVARLVESAGCDRVLSIDLHCGQIQGFFKIPVDNLMAKPVLVQEIMSRLRDLENVCIVSPDAGGAERADSFRHDFNRSFDYNAGMAVMNKKRVEANKIERMELVGNVQGCDCIIVDDMIDTAGTLCTAAKVLMENGAKRVFACATHALLNGRGVKNIEESVIEKVIVTNTVPQNKDKTHEKIIYVSVARILSEAIRRVHNEESISILF